MKITDEALAFLRELEVHLVAVELATRSDILPFAGARCARRILDDALRSLDVIPHADLPPIADVEADRSEEGG